jgi:light-regulated signal transduction histidine kinase (bacteriophytochrome)
MIQNRIEACERQPYHLSAQIQPHGVFCAADPVSLKIVHASANAGPFFGREAEAILGSNFCDILTPESAAKLSGLAAMDHSSRKSILLNFADPTGFTADAFVYRSGSLICIEFELARPDHTAIEVASSRFFGLVERITQTGTASALPGVVCEAIRDVTGADRVYYCRFDQHGHGHVQGEGRNEVLPELLDHHFPATDIPAAARRMFLFNPFRLIPDADAAPVPILGGGSAPLDLTMSTCRAVAETHLQYNRNMGVKASFSFPVIRDGHVEAIFGGHNAAALHLSFRQMAISRHLVELFKSRSDFLRAREEHALLAERVEALYLLSGSFEAAGRDLAAFIAGHHDAFCALMDADDVICCYKAQTHLGHSLPRAGATRLLEFLRTKLATGPDFYQTDCIGDDEGQFASLCPDVAGVCAVSLDLLGNSIVAWLRREVVTVQKWSGDPNNPVVINEEGGVGPRTSFLAYMREVKGTSRPWPSVSADLARQLRHVFAQVLANHYEIGMRKAAEESNALKSEFVANISHELRSPMHAIIGFADVLAAAGDMPAEKRKRAAGVIQESSRRLLRLINDLLDLSKLEAGKMAFAFADGDIRKTAVAAIAEVGSLARVKKVEISVEDRRRSLLSRFDTARISQVMINLLSNALKFSPPGGRITIVLDTPEPGPDGPRMAVEVADQGIGIPGGELEAVFDKFIQSSRTKSGAGGTGLGLAICRDIIEAHHGRIWATNNSTGGASFLFEIPIQFQTGHEAS